MGGVVTLFILLILFHVSLLVNSVIAVNPSGFSMKMFRRDSKESPSYPGDHLTQEERFERLIQQSKNRARYIGRKISSLNNSINALFPVTYDGVGAYVAAVGIGSFDAPYEPYERHYLMVDTGSDLTWIQCKGATSFFPQEQPLYAASSSRTYQPLRCYNRRRTVENPDCYSELCDDEGMCTYETSYEDGTSTTGKLAKEKFTINTAHRVLDSFTIVMGCGLNQVNMAGSRPQVFSGTLGLSKGSKSLVTQLNLGKFEYCLKPYMDGIDGTHTYLRFGSDTRLDNGVRQALRTPLYNYLEEHYYLVLKDISVNESRVGFTRGEFQYKASTRRGGCIIDSGTTMSVMRESLFHRVAEKVTEYFHWFGLYPITPSPFQNTLCFPSPNKRFVYPTITFHFENANFFLHGHDKDTVFKIFRNYICLGIVPETESDDSPYHFLFGAMQQACKRILHNVEEQRLYFREEDCRYDFVENLISKT